METTLFPQSSQWPALVQRPVQPLDDMMDRVRPIFDAVRHEGDEALRRFSQRFDGAAIDSVELSKGDLSRAAERVSPALRQAIDAARNNIARFHRAQSNPDTPIEVIPGVRCWRRTVPIERVGLYVPGGVAPLFSTALMLAVPAQVAGCPEVVLCTPPNSDETIHPAIAYVAQTTGVTNVMRVGGAQAIAALAFGTQSIPRVHKIFGPGNQYVTVAKQLASAQGVAIDLPAGPSEVLVVADASANPRFVAADLLSQAEHGTDSQVILVTTDKSLAEAVTEQITLQLDTLPRREIARQSLGHARCIVVSTVHEAIRFANAYAPEHLILMVEDAEAACEQVTAAGSVFLGPWSPEAAGDYASGPNHTLPTNGHARAFSGVSLDSFIKHITVQRIDERGLKALAPTIEALAEAEGLRAHAQAVRLRMEDIESKAT